MLLGDFHTHSTLDDGKSTLEEMAAAAVYRQPDLKVVADEHGAHRQGVGRHRGQADGARTR